MNIVESSSGFQVYQDGICILSHSSDSPAIFYGVATAKIKEYQGNFNIEDYVEQRVPLRSFRILANYISFFTEDKQEIAKIHITESEGKCHFKLSVYQPSVNRIWLRIPALTKEYVYGGGEQFSYFNLRGKRFEIFTREQGVGRNKNEYITFLADSQMHAGGNYDWTFFPQPTFLSSKKYYFHLNEYCYSALDFTHETYHEVEIWANECSFVIDTADTWKSLLTKLTDYLGRQPVLPDWAMKGIWLGIQGGTEVVNRKLSYMKQFGTDITAVWCQDWEGIQMTSFGKRLMWNWVYDPNLYPDLPEKIRDMNTEGIQFLGYINPYLRENKSLFNEAKQKGFLALNPHGEVYTVDFGEFLCGVVDFTNENAFEWYKNVLKQNLIGIGLGGWMADFGEYLPTDCVLHDGRDALVAHNEWPALWARLNYEALSESNKLGELAVFFRAGATGSQRYAPIIWAGDQNVDWSLDDGLASVIVAALSAGMSGHGMHTSDVGGYTTLFHLKRTKELLMRWAEFCTFTPILRTHEGNRPGVNHQFDSDEETALHFARLSQIHTMLFPYLKKLMTENSETGIPVMRPLFLEYPSEPETYELKYQYLLGPDLLVAPVYIEGAEQVSIYCPKDSFINLWTGEVIESGYNTVLAPMGKPAVFYREKSNYSDLFKAIKNL